MKSFNLEQLQAVIFDVGGVMLRTHDPAFRHRWDARLGLPKGTIEELVFNSDLGTAAQLGRVTTDAHWAAVGARLELGPAELAELRRDFWAGDRFDFEMIDWIRSWRHAKQTAIISNAFDDLRAVLLDEFQVGDAFDLIVVSAEEGIMKPSAEIYRACLERLSCRPEAAVFIDDSPRNIAGAEAVGLRGILYRPSVDLPAQLPIAHSQ